MIPETKSHYTGTPGWARRTIVFNWQALTTAFSLLTRLGRWSSQPPAPEVQSRAALFYPLIGAVIGGLLVVLYVVMPDKIGVTVQATMLVGLWVWLTGAMHLADLAKSADALSTGDSSSIADILRDPRLSAWGVTALVMVLLLKLALLRTILEIGASYWALLAAPIGARLLVLIYIMITPRASIDTDSNDLELRPYQPIVIGLALIALVASVWVMGRLAGTALVVSLALWVVHWQHRWSRAVGGYTNSSLGALIEVAEVVILFLVVLTW